MAMGMHTNAKLLGGATQEDLAKCVQSVGPDETMIAIWRVPEELRSSAAMSNYAPIFMLPCFWPHALACSPCICMGISAEKSLLKGTTYVLTNKSLHVMVNAELGPCGCCLRTGKDSSSMPLNEVGSVAVNAKGGGACECCSFPALMVGTTPGSPMANYGGSKHTAASTLRMIMNDPDEAAAMLRAAKEQYQRDLSMGGMMQMQMSQQMMMQQQPGGILPPGYTSMSAAGAPAEDPAAKIMQLKGLLDAGAITEVEFERKKAALLSTM